MEIRPFRPTDLDRILEIERASFGRDAWPRGLFLEFASRCPDLFLVVKHSRQVSAYSLTCVVREKAELASIAVAPRFRRAGLAQALLDHTRAELRRQRVQSWWLMVRVDNATAIAFYRRYGFIRSRIVKNYYENHVSAYRMRIAP